MNGVHSTWRVVNCDLSNGRLAHYREFPGWQPADNGHTDAVREILGKL